MTEEQETIISKRSNV